MWYFKRKFLVAVFLTLYIAGLSLTGSAGQVEDIISQMPAKSNAAQHELDKELLNLAPESMEKICAMLRPEGEGKPEARYALNSLVAYCSAEKRGDEREMLEGVMLDAIPDAKDAEVKVFLVDQLRWIASEESVPVLSELLKDERMCDPAARVLITLGNDSAEAALIKALPAAKESQKVSIIKALGQLGSTDAQDMMTRYAQSEDSRLRDVSLYALANSGAEDAYDLLMESMQKGSNYERDRNAGYLLIYADRRAGMGDGARAVEICETILDGEASGQGDAGLRCAALSQIVDIRGAKAFRRLVSVMRSDDTQLQGAAMQLAKRFKEDKYIRIWGKLVPRVSDPAAIRIVRFLGRSDSKAAVEPLQKAVAIGNAELSRAALTALLRLDAEVTDFFVATLPELDIGQAELIEVYRSVAPRVAETETKKELLEDLSELNSTGALEIVAGFIDDPEVSQEASRTAVEMTVPGDDDKGMTNPAVAEILFRAAQNIDSPSTREKAMAHVAKVREMHGLEKMIPSRDDPGFVKIFNEKDLEGWQGNTKAHIPENGILKYDPKRGGGNLYTKEQYDNFVFRFEFKLTPGANNGLGIRTPRGKDAAYHGMEIQILDNTAEKYANLKPYQYHGSIYGIVPAQLGRLRPVGQWNEEEVIVDGRDVKVILNGETIVDANLDEATEDGTLDGKAHPGLDRKKGYICFCSHGSLVYFRNIRIKELD